MLSKGCYHSAWRPDSDAGLNGRTAAACWGRGLEVEAAAKLTKRSEMEHVSHNSQDFTALQVATPFAVDSDFSFPLLMIVRNEGQQPSRNWKNSSKITAVTS